MKNDLKSRVKKIQARCLDNKLSVADAVSEIDQVIGGITRVIYKPGLKCKIINHSGNYGLNIIGLSNKELSRLEGLAVVAYFRAKENGSLHPGEVHISENASTKDHTGGIYEILSRYVAA